jgi:choline dehydrogenase-like flavoprotein
MSPAVSTTPQSIRLSDHERKIVAALARAAFPQGELFEGGGDPTVAKFERFLASSHPTHVRAFRGFLWAAEAAPIATTRRPLTLLSRERAIEFLERWAEAKSFLGRSALRAIMSPLKAAHFDDATMFDQVGCASFHAPERALTIAEPARWMQQVTNGRAVEDDLELECEVVVVGTGAGGAACAYELALRGRAVVMLEEGDYHRRDTLTGRAQPMVKKLYRDEGMTIALGNVGVPVFAGRAVGGSTLVNSGTCYRATERVFSRWRSDFGLDDFSSDAMDPYYARVEAMLGVTRAKATLTGGVGRVVARGAEALGMKKHHPIARNAPDCDGQGVCAFGCPTAAKRSTDVSYVPAALERGARLVTAARVDGIDVVAGRARGVTGKLASGRRVHVKAEAVVIAGGALMTPVLLKKAGVFTGSTALGTNLSIHPAAKVLAIFDEAIDQSRGIPQGYSIEDFADDGLMLEGASMPLDVVALSIPWVGRKLVRVLEQYRHVATFGLMVEDTSRGHVRPGPRGSPLITYDLNRADAAKLQRGIATVCEVFLAAGARRVFPFLPGMPELSSKRDVAQLRALSLSPSDIEVTAYHPLGTCRMGTDPRSSVLGPDYETHEVKSLYVADGSAIPSALGVNPQLTIMAMALRAAETIDGRLS